MISMSDSVFTLTTGIISLVVSIFVFLIYLNQLKVQKETLSLEMFLKSLDQIGTNEAREARAYIHKFQDLTLIEPYQTSLTSSLHNQIIYNVKTKSVVIEYEYYFADPTDKDWEMITDVAVRIDRLGFILYNIDISEKTKQAYLEWWCSTIVDCWNRLAPFIYLKRNERSNYVPYFEKLSQLAFSYYIAQKIDAKLVSLKTS